MNTNHLHFSRPLSPFLRPTLSHASSISNSTTPDLVDLSNHCIGTPHNICSSKSGSISLSLSLQEDTIFLPYPSSSSSYHEQDEGSAPDSGSNPPNYPDPLNENFPDQSPSSIFNPYSDEGGLDITGMQQMNPRLSLHTASLGTNSSASDLPPSILRGSLLLKLTKPTKIKDISLRFYGKCKTEWLESNVDQSFLDHSLPCGPQFQDEVIISSHTWEFMPTPDQAAVKSSIVNMDSTSVVSSDLYGADVVYIMPDSNTPLISNCSATPGQVSFKTPISSSTSGESNADTLRPTISHLSQNDIPFFSPAYFDEARCNYAKEESTHSFTANSHSKPTVYPAGEYIFHFTLAIDARTAETVVCPKGAIKYYLVAKVERPSRFTFGITGHKEVTLVRSPPSIGEMASNTPLAISRDWDDRLHYDISCPKKFIPLGSSIPLSIKLTPIDKVRVHRVRVQVVETVTYISARLSILKHQEPKRKVLFFQKTAVNPNAPVEDEEDKSEALNRTEKAEKAKKKSRLAMMTGNLLHLSDEPTNNSGSSDTPKPESRQIAGTTELDITMPFVTADGDWDSVANHHFTPPASNSNYFQFLRPDAIFNPLIHVKHRLHISFRISKLDPATSKWRFFEVLIDTPIHFLSRHCKTESVELPRYTDISWGDQEPEPEPSYPEDSEPERQSNSNNDGIPIIGSPTWAGIGSPLVRSLSSPFSSSPPVEGFNYLSLNDPLSGQLPSFDDALSDRLCGESAVAAAVAAAVTQRHLDSDSVSVASVLSDPEVTSQDTGSSLSLQATTTAPAGGPPLYDSIREMSSSPRLRPQVSNAGSSGSSSFGLFPTVRPRPSQVEDPEEGSPLEGFTSLNNRFGDLQGSQF